jgi:peptide/nickel transport system ATP-binding protein
MEPEGVPVFEARGLSHSYPGGFLRPRRVALRDVSFRLHRRQAVVLLGESGSGKTTLARIVARLIRPTAGTFLLEGRDVLKAEPRRASREYRRRVQMISQNPFTSLNPAHTIGYHLGRPLLLHRKVRDHRDLQERIRELLAAVGLGPPSTFLEGYPHELSGGERQRVALARALAVDPVVLVADEPVSMLDGLTRAGVLGLLSRVKQEWGLALLQITHDVADARCIGDRIVVLCAGCVVEEGPVERLLANPLHPYTQQLVAASSQRGGWSSTARTSAPGPPPSEGCPFADRCPQVMKDCRRLMPPAERIGPDQLVRCHLYPPEAP